jgi:hypothetical protein
MSNVAALRERWSMLRSSLGRLAASPWVLSGTSFLATAVLIQTQKLSIF